MSAAVSSPTPSAEPTPAKGAGFDGFSFDQGEASQSWPVGLGEPVVWYPDSDQHQEPIPAFVTKVGHDSILSVAILASGYHNFMVREGVRHITDFRAKDAEKRESGAWDYGPIHKRLTHIQNSIKELWKVIPRK